METRQEVAHAKTWCGQVQGDLLLNYSQPISVFISTYLRTTVEFSFHFFQKENCICVALFEKRLILPLVGQNSILILAS